MFSEADAKEFARKWADAWNQRDMDKILSHYTDDFVIETPIAAKLIPDSHGVVTGKKAVRVYWQSALEKIPDLHFEVLDVLTGINGLTIYYINKATNRRSVEIMFFDTAGKVNKAIVHYS